MKRFAPLLALVLSFAVYAADDAKPAAKPLTASAEQLAKIPNLAPGPYEVRAGEPVEWELGDHEVRLRVVEPVGKPGEKFPLVIFSHGFASDVTEYDALLKHWASHGYLSIAPYHLDGGGLVRAIFNSTRKGNAGLVKARVDDIKWLLDHLGDLDAVEPGLAARIDTSRIALAGHSFGAFTAQQFGGASTVDPDNGSRVEGLDKRVRAVVAVSPPGNMFGIINDKSWLAMQVPMLDTTGTWDTDGRFVTQWQQHTLSWQTAPAGKNWLLVIEGADHYLGNLICRTNKKEPSQTDALKMVNASAVTFLDAFVKDDAVARAFFEQRPLKELTGGFARIDYR